MQHPFANYENKFDAYSFKITLNDDTFQVCTVCKLCTIYTWLYHMFENSISPYCREYSINDF